MAESIVNAPAGGPVKLSFFACNTCQAVIDVTLNGESVLPAGRDGHDKWHQALADRLAELDTSVPPA